MSEPDKTDGNKEPDALQTQREMALRIVKGMGAVFMLGGPAIGFNLGGISSALGFADGFIEVVAGIMFFTIGLVDFFVIPKIIIKKR